MQARGDALVTGLKYFASATKELRRRTGEQEGSVSFWLDIGCLDSLAHFSVSFGDQLAEIGSPGVRPAKLGEARFQLRVGKSSISTNACRSCCCPTLHASIATAVRSSSNRPKGRDPLVRCQHRAVPGCPPPGLLEGTYWSCGTTACK